jgi:hypothetical protein
MEFNESSRRRFLKTVLTLSAATAMPALLKGKTSGRDMPVSKPAAPGERVNIACCGIGNQGGNIIGPSIIPAWPM